MKQSPWEVERALAIENSSDGCVRVVLRKAPDEVHGIFIGTIVCTAAGESHVQIR